MISEHKCIINVLIFNVLKCCHLANVSNWQLCVHKNCTYFDGLWADRLLPICCFALENNAFYCSKCYYQTFAMFRAQNFSCSNKTVPSSPSQGNSNVALLMTETPDFIPPTLWPPNSLDFNPVGYCVWNILQERVYNGWQCGRLETAHRGWMGSSRS